VRLEVCVDSMAEMCGERNNRCVVVCVVPYGLVGSGDVSVAARKMWTLGRDLIDKLGYSAPLVATCLHRPPFTNAMQSLYLPDSDTSGHVLTCHDERLSELAEARRHLSFSGAVSAGMRPSRGAIHSFAPAKLITALFIFLLLCVLSFFHCIMHQETTGSLAIIAILSVLWM
jgi:hypothetical protein